MAVPAATLHWSFQPSTISGTTVSDQGSAGVDGTLINSPTTGVSTGRTGIYAVDFNGSNQLCRAAFASLPTPSSSWSVGCYVRFDTNGTRIPFHIGGGLGSTNPLGVRIERQTSNKLWFIIGNGSIDSILSSNTAPSDGAWVACIISWSGTVMRLSVHWDGGSDILESTPGIAGPSYDSGSYVECGGRIPVFNIRYLDGAVGDFRWWNGTVLTRDQELDYTRLFFGDSRTRYRYPDSQNEAGTVYDGVIDMSRNLILAHMDEDVSLTESAQSLTVDESTYLTGGGEYSIGHLGLFDRSVKFSGRGGVSFGGVDAVYPPTESFWYSCWFYNEPATQAAAAPSSYQCMLSRGYTGTSYVADGWGTSHNGHGGRFAGASHSAGSLSPPATPVRTWCMRFGLLENNGADGRFRVWEHHGVDDPDGVLVLDATISTTNLDWSSFSAQSGKSPWLLGREYALGPAPMNGTRVTEFALFDGVLDDDTRKAIYARQAGLYSSTSLPSIKPYIFAEEKPTSGKWTTDGSDLSADQSDADGPGRLGVDSVLHRPTFPNAGATTWYYNVAFSTAYRVQVVGIVGHNFDSGSGVEVALEVDDNASFASPSEVVKWSSISDGKRLISVLPIEREFESARLKITAGASFIPSFGELILGYFIPMPSYPIVPFDDQHLESSVGVFESESGAQAAVIRNRYKTMRDWRFEVRSPSEDSAWQALYYAANGGAKPVGEVDDPSTPTRLWYFRIGRSRAAPLRTFALRDVRIQATEIAPFMEAEEQGIL